MMERKAHLLKQPKRVVMPEYLVFVDTETYQHKRKKDIIEHELRLGVAIFYRRRRDGKSHKEETFRFTTTEQFWEWVLSKPGSHTVLYLLSHNATFDFTVLESIGHLTDAGYKDVFNVDKGSVFIAKWRGKGRTIMILNTANWFKGPLAKWGDELGLPKHTMPPERANDNVWFTYCTQDTQIIKHLFLWYLGFLEEHDLGSWKYTIASQAFNAYRHRFMGWPIYIPDTPEETSLARQSYKGGRTEIFKVGEYDDGPYYKLDVNSMYPYTMRNNKYPTSFLQYGTDISLSQLDQCLQKECVIADCLVETPIPYFPVKPAGVNVYPVGWIDSTLTTNELSLALNNGWLRDIYAYARYRARPIFTDYVDFFYQLKAQYTLEGKILLRAFTKLYLNTLYGKFGQRGYYDKVIGETKEPGMRVSHGMNVQTGQRFTLRQIGTQLMYHEQKGEGYNAFCAIASHVTANARIDLYDLVLTAARANCFYCDTDSVIVNEEGKERLAHLLHDTELGRLKIEAVSPNVRVVAPKHYRFNNKWVRKGIRKNAQELAPNVFRQEQWSQFDTILRTGRETYFHRMITKHLNPLVRSGDVGRNGTVRPYKLERRDD